MILLENGVQVNPCDKRGNTPLHFCCNNGHMDSAKLLMIVSIITLSTVNTLITISHSMEQI